MNFEKYEIDFISITPLVQSIDVNPCNHSNFLFCNAF